MYSKRSIFYYIFWIFSPLLFGGALAWGAVTGAKIAYENFFEHGRTYVMNSGEDREAVTGIASAVTSLAEKGNENKESDRAESSAIELQDTFDTNEAVAGADEKNLIKKIEESLPKKIELKTTAFSYVAADLDSGEIFLEKNKDEVLPIASVTKLVTAYVSLQNLKQDEIITIPKSATDTYGETGELKSGEKIRVGDLLYPLLFESSNDAAETLARIHGRVAFLDAMNEAVLAMGATHTAFSDASGLSPRNTSTSLDLFKIAEFIYKKEKIIFDITKLSSYTTKTHTWTNSALFLRVPSYLGGKNGYTDEADRTAVSLWNIPQKNGVNRNVVVVVLKSEDRNTDIAAIVNYLAENFTFPDIPAPTTSDREMDIY
ncbi:MAG: serine hydrolase [Candidatus Taylorbacteria bacterium]